MSEAQILADFPQLTSDDVRAGGTYAPERATPPSLRPPHEMPRLFFHEPDNVSPAHASKGSPSATRTSLRAWRSTVCSDFPEASNAMVHESGSSNGPRILTVRRRLFGLPRFELRRGAGPPGARLDLSADIVAGGDGTTNFEKNAILRETRSG